MPDQGPLADRFQDPNEPSPRPSAREKGRGRVPAIQMSQLIEAAKQGESAGG